MASARHLRSESSESSSSGSGSSYQLILDHILSYPGSYEIPLRTMYTLNCAPRGQARSGSPPSSNNSSPVNPQGPWNQGDNATQTFTESLMAQISRLPNQPTSLPPSFITNFLRKCFPPRLPEVDFPQALTGLDYLKDLETRRRREVANAMARLDVSRDTLDSESEAFASQFPDVASWVKSMEEKERKIDALYTQLYIGIRRWIIINELKLTPFNKHNAVAMLNTLYPPVISTQPTSKLNREILKHQRDGFFKYILSVEKHGDSVLQNLMLQGKGPADANGWVAVTRTLSQYLQLANSIINECNSVSDVDQITPRKNSEAQQPARQNRKADSGVSFTTVDIPSTRSSSIAEPVSPTETARPRTPGMSTKPSSSALEKLARGLKSIGRSRTDATEMISDPTPPPQVPEKSKSLRKMKSMGSIDSRKGSKVDLAAEASQSFNVDQMRQERMKFDRGVLATQKYGTNHKP